MKYPLVSCVCPTKDRPDFLRMLIRYYQKQDYPNKELIIVDEGRDCRKKMPEDSSIFYSFLHNGPNTIGQKRNICGDLAHGELICHFDSDDWFAPDRISKQVAVMQANPKAQGTAYKTMLFARDDDQKAWRFTGHGPTPKSGANLVGGSLMYRRQWWKQHQFNESLPFGEDHSFVQMFGTRLVVADHDRIVARIHDGNTCKRDEKGNLANREFWQEAEWNEVLRLGYEAAVVCA